MEYLKGKMLHKSDGLQVAAETVVEGSTLIVFYFSAVWCQPCKPFTEILSECLREWQENKQPISVILVSGDTSEKDFLAYVKTTNFLGLHFEDAAVDALSMHFSIPGMPYLVVVNRSGQVLSDTAKNDVMAKRAKCIEDWLEKERGLGKPTEAAEAEAKPAEAEAKPVEAETAAAAPEALEDKAKEAGEEEKVKEEEGVVAKKAPTSETTETEKKFAVPTKSIPPAK